MLMHHTKSVPAFLDAFWIGRVDHKDNSMTFPVVAFPDRLEICLPTQILKVYPCTSNVNPTDFFFLIPGKTKEETKGLSV